MKFKATTDLEKAIKAEVDSIPINELEDRELCIGCVAAGINLRDSLHSSDDMQAGPKTSDIKCKHCYITEYEFGKLTMTPKEDGRSSYIAKLYENYKADRVGAAV